MQAQKMESVGRLAGGVAHDFNNMLQAILGYSELCLMEAEPQTPMHERITQIKDAAGRASDLTRQLLAFARKQTIRPKILDLNESVAATMKMLRRLIGEDIALVLKPGPSLWPILIDPAQLDQVLANLCVNARDAISGVGTVTIETANVVLDSTFSRTHPGAEPGAYVLISVSDTGTGMDTGTLKHIFEPFFTTKELGKGTGLGLATVYGIINQNKGAIDVRSQPGTGTTFTVYLPKTSGHEEQTEESTREGGIVKGSETLLLVEDEEIILGLEKTILQDCGYRVLAAANPMDAVAMAEKHEGPIHLLITDVVMPEMNGMELKEAVCRTHPDMMCLFMSGYPSDVIARKGVLYEGVNFLQKPFTVRSLTLKVRAVLEDGPKT
jgi:CheY-like chemotaxis protein